MEDRMGEIWNQYEFKINRFYRAKGGIILETDQGLKLMSPSKSSVRRVEFEDAVKKQIYANGYERIDTYVRNTENQILSTDKAGDSYIIREWFSLEEGMLNREESVLCMARNLALLHLAMSGITIPEGGTCYEQESISKCFEKRTREIKRVGSYLLRRKKKSSFEIKYTNCFQQFYEEALQAQEMLDSLPVKELLTESLANGKVLHGGYSYHNVLLSNRLGKSSFGDCPESEEIATVHFEKAVFGLQVYDLYQFLRKTLEKNDWQVTLGEKILASYENVRALSKDEKKLLFTLLTYPEKFWKVTNYYYNARKSLIPQKNAEKLLILLNQQEKKRLFLRSLCQQ